MPQGVVKKVVLEKGFGFIGGEAQDLFFHCSSVEGGVFEDLLEGAAVEYEREESPRGARAVQVRVLDGVPPAPVASLKPHGAPKPYVDQESRSFDGSEFSGTDGEMKTGAIKKIVQDRGFGFIGADGRDIFFHCSQVREADFDSLLEGQTVEYMIGQGPHGPRAENVRPAKEAVEAS